MVCWRNLGRDLAVAYNLSVNLHYALFTVAPLRWLAGLAKMNSETHCFARSTVASPHVVIAMCTLNGGAYLDEQLESFEHQHHKNWSLWISDDGSTDNTLEILERWKKRWLGAHDLKIVSGPERGAATNFLSLLCNPNLPTAYVALSDQDDVWHPHKLERAVQHLSLLRDGAIGLYGAQRSYTDATLNVLAQSSHPQHPASFENALVQNVITGHSAVLTPAGLNLVRQAGICDGVAFHDWWLYQLVSGVGGEVIVDEEVVLSYRQHGQNAIGARFGLRAYFRRLQAVFDGTYGEWVGGNLRSLTKANIHLTQSNLETVVHVLATPKGLKRAQFLIKAKLFRQDRLETLLVMLSALLKRL